MENGIKTGKTAKVWRRFASNACLVLRFAQEAGAEVVIRCVFEGCPMAD